MKGNLPALVSSSARYRTTALWAWLLFNPKINFSRRIFSIDPCPSWSSFAALARLSRSEFKFLGCLTESVWHFIIQMESEYLTCQEFLCSFRLILCPVFKKSLKFFNFSLWQRLELEILYSSWPLVQSWHFKKDFTQVTLSVLVHFNLWTHKGCSELLW